MEKNCSWRSVFPIVFLFTFSSLKWYLQRNFGLLSIVGLTCILMVTWEGSLTLVLPLSRLRVRVKWLPAASTLDLPMAGLPDSSMVVFFFVWIGTTLQALVMGEMASMFVLWANLSWTTANFSEGHHSLVVNTTVTLLHQYQRAQSSEW